MRSFWFWGFCFWRGARSVDANVNSVPMLEFSREGPRILDALEEVEGLMSGKVLYMFKEAAP